MRLTPADRQRALTEMPRQHPARTMLRVGLLTRALVYEGATHAQQRRLDTELRPIIERLKAAQQQTNMAGTVAILADQANMTLTSILDGWTPRPDNPIDRECRTDLLTPLTDL